MGCARLVQSTEAGMLEIHMDMKVPSSIMPRRRTSGRSPKGLSTALASILDSFCFSSTAPMLKPARKSRMVGLKNSPHISLAAFSADSGVPEGETRHWVVTARTGTRRDVMCRGMASVAHRIETRNTMASDRRAAGIAFPLSIISPPGGARRNQPNTTMENRRLFHFTHCSIPPFFLVGIGLLVMGMRCPKVKYSLSISIVSSRLIVERRAAPPLMRRLRYVGPSPSDPSIPCT
mmetsp:Transcript_30079/g.79434  ORF Transcript_30079/g.79434 Transcript_30079/m.79434 type:complete len:234 (+) Transcript_30079:175-876(+)